MSDLLTPNTTVALMQASQGNNIDAIGKKLLSAEKMEEIDRVAQDFEAVFVSEMMKPMFDGIKADGPFGGGRGEEIFRGMMIDEYGKSLASTGGIGIAEQVKKELIRMQTGEAMAMQDATSHTGDQRTIGDILKEYTQTNPQTNPKGESTDESS